MEAKYLSLLDDEVIAFIRRTEEFYPADAVNASIEDQRRYYDALCKAFAGEWPEEVTKTDHWVTAREGHVAIRNYEVSDPNPKAKIIYIHGGGFVVGGLDSHDSICAEFCARTGMNVTSIDYRLCPENPHPAGYLDCLNVYRRLKDQDDTPIILAGDSAGGTLVASLVQSLGRAEDRIVGQLLIYPALGGDKSLPSYLEHENAPMLTRADMEFYESVRGEGRDLSLDPTATPLAADDFAGLPPTVILTAECDPLASDGGAYQSAIEGAGGAAIWINEKGLVHGYLRARFISKRAAESVARIVDALNMFAAREWKF